MYHDQKRNCTVLAFIQSGDLMGTENGCFDTGDDDHCRTMKTTEKEPIKNIVKPLTCRRTNAAAKREFPPPVTTWVTRRHTKERLQTARNQFDFVRSSSDDGRRLVVQAHERIHDDKKYYLKVRRSGGRLTMSLAPIENVSDDDHDHEDVVDGDDDDDCVEGDGKREQVKAVADHGDSSQQISIL